jgi:hypothetical protein
MRALILYHLVQAQATERHRQARREVSARAASQAAAPGHHPARAPRPRAPGRGGAPAAHRAGGSP